MTAGQMMEYVAPSLRAFEKELHKAAARREFQERISLVTLSLNSHTISLWSTPAPSTHRRTIRIRAGHCRAGKYRGGMAVRRDVRVLGG